MDLKNPGKLREDFTTLSSSLETTMRPVWVKVATKYKVVSGVPLCIWWKDLGKCVNAKQHSKAHIL